MNDFWHDTDPVTGFTHSELNGTRIEDLPPSKDRRIKELEAENEKYRLGMQENCKLRKEIAELESERDKLREALTQISKPDKVIGYYNCRRLAKAALEKE